MVAVPPAVPHTPGTWRLIYFDAPNRGEQIRQLFFLAGVPFDDVRVRKFPEGLEPYKAKALGDDSPLLGTDQCPAVTAPDGTHCVETSDIMHFVGHRLGLAPEKDSAMDKKATEVTRLMQHLMDGVFYGLLKQMVVRHIFASEFFGGLSWARTLLIGRETKYLPRPDGELREALATLEGHLVESGGPFVCGEQLTYADASVTAILREVLAFDCFDRGALLAPHPKLARCLAELEARTAPWVERRIAEHQLGIASTVGLFAALHTPFPWSRKAMPDEVVAQPDRG